MKSICVYPLTTMKSETIIEALKAVPPVAVVALTLNEWATIATVVYVILQGVYLIRKWWREETTNV